MAKTGNKSIVIIGVIIIIFIIGGIVLSITSNKSSENVSVVTDTRTLLTLENMADYNSRENPRCDEEFNKDKSNTTVRFSSMEKGLAFDIPYNANWGTQDLRLDAYWETDTHIWFGPMFGFEACSWVRSHIVEVLEQRNAQEVIGQVQAFAFPPTIIELNGVTVVKYADFGMCTYATLHVIGEKYNYEFRPVCGDDIEQDFAYLEEMVKSVEFVN